MKFLKRKLFFFILLCIDITVILIIPTGKKGNYFSSHCTVFGKSKPRIFPISETTRKGAEGKPSIIRKLLPIAPISILQLQNGVNFL